MKKTFIYIMLLAALTGCDDQPITFPDFDFQAVYFPLQLPLRTLSLGEDRVDNSLDRELIFNIGVSIGGMYENKTNWTVDYVVDETLTDSLYNSVNKRILPLPSDYYTLEPANTAVIPSGSFRGLIKVQLTPDFLNDPLAIEGRYVVPVRLTDTSADSILQGMTASGIEDPDRRIVTDWEAAKTPKDWVLFGIKYVNAYHGSYLHRGRDIRFQAGVPVDTVIYHQRFVEKDQIWKLTTSSKDTVITNGIGNMLSSGSSVYSMKLGFSNTSGASGPITIMPVTGSIYKVNGTGNFFDIASSEESIIGLKMQSLHLSYTYPDGIYTHQVNDTLVFRDRGMKYEELSIVIKQ